MTSTKKKAAEAVEKRLERATDEPQRNPRPKRSM